MVASESAFIRERLFAPSASITKKIREAQNSSSPKETLRSEAMINAAASGDYSRVAKLLAKSGQLPESGRDGFEERLATYLDSISQILPGFGGTVEFLKFDFIFQQAVMPFLPESAMADHQLLMKVADSWKLDDVRLSSISLNAFAALVESIHYQPQRDFKASELPDQRHAAYAPLVEMFTCDRRNEKPLKKAIASMGENATVIMRNGRLDVVLRKGMDGLL